MPNAGANELACTTRPVGPVEEMDVNDNEHSSEDWNPGESAKRDIKGKGKQRQHETDHEMGGTTDAGVTRRTYQRPAKATGSCHVPLCLECQKKNLDCEKESTSGACVQCYTQKASVTKAGVEEKEDRESDMQDQCKRGLEQTQRGSNMSIWTRRVAARPTSNLLVW
jgi:hypothetical protein